MERIDVALVGAGRMGQVHGPNAARHPGLRLKYVVDARPGVAEAMAGRWQAGVAGLEQALADPSVGGVLVCSSTDQPLTPVCVDGAAGQVESCKTHVVLRLASS